MVLVITIVHTTRRPRILMSKNIEAATFFKKNMYSNTTYID